jgi:hypothetical protein
VFVSAILLSVRGAAAALQAHPFRARLQRARGGASGLAANTPLASLLREGMLWGAFPRPYRLHAKGGIMKAQIATQQSNQRKAVLDLVVLFENAGPDDNYAPKANRIIDRCFKGGASMEQSEVMLTKVERVRERLAE